MAYSDAHEAAKELARARWGTRGLDRAVGVVIERAGQLTPEQAAAIEAAITPPTGQDRLDPP
jgi:hypothetical protein